MLLLDRHTRGAKLMDGRKRLWCATSLGVPLFPVEIQSRINAHGSQTTTLLTSNKVSAYRCCAIETVERDREMSGTRQYVNVSAVGPHRWI